MTMITQNVPFKISIKGARVNAGYTQNEFAKAIGVSRSAVGKWENDECIPTLSHLRLISEITGIPLDYIFIPFALPKVDLTTKKADLERSTDSKFDSN